MHYKKREGSLGVQRVTKLKERRRRKYNFDKFTYGLSERRLAAKAVGVALISRAGDG